MKNAIDSSPLSRQILWARWSVVMLLGVIAAGLLVSLGISAAAAQSQPIGEGGKESIFVVAGQISRETYGLYLVDYKNSTICVYQFTRKDRMLRLIAARTYAYDVQLDAYNTPTEMSPAEVRRIIGKQKRLKSKDIQGDAGTETPAGS